MTQKTLKGPQFLIYDQAFLETLGPNPKIDLVLEKDWPFAHEAGVYIPSQDAVYFTSSYYLPKGASEKTITISKITRKQNGWKCEEVPTAVSMANGAVNHTDRSQILFCEQGSLTEPGGLTLMETTAPYKTKTLIQGYHGRLFNSVNDVVYHTDGSIWFTDPTQVTLKKEMQCAMLTLQSDTASSKTSARSHSFPSKSIASSLRRAISEW